MTSLSASVTARLQAAGVDLDLLAALVEAGALRRVNDHAFQIPCKRADGSTAAWHTAVDGEAEPWIGDERPAAWWPVGEDGQTAIVVVGFETGLALASLLFHVADDGTVRRRPNLPGVLADAVPVVLPERLREVPVEWVISDEAPRELLTLLTDAGCDLAFVALVVEPAAHLPTEIAVRDFVDACAFAAPAGLIIAPVLLPGGVRLTDPVLRFRGHGRRYALAGLLEFWLQVALHPPTPAEEDE